MFCPKCKCEYRKGFTLCSDCKIPLVEKLTAEKGSEKPEVEYVDYELILSTFNYADISLLKSLFDAEDIVYYIRGENMGIAPGGLPASVFVKKDQIDDVKDLLKDFNLVFTV